MNAEDAAREMSRRGTYGPARTARTLMRARDLGERVPLEDGSTLAYEDGEYQITERDGDG